MSTSTAPSRTANEHNNGPRLAQQTVFFQRSGLSSSTHTIVGQQDHERRYGRLRPDRRRRRSGLTGPQLRRCCRAASAGRSRGFPARLAKYWRAPRKPPVNAGATATLVEGFYGRSGGHSSFRVAEGSYQLRAYDYPEPTAQHPPLQALPQPVPQPVARRGRDRGQLQRHDPPATVGICTVTVPPMWSGAGDNRRRLGCR